MQNWFGLTEKFQVLKICPRKIPKFASGNFFNVAILVRFNLSDYYYWKILEVYFSASSFRILSITVLNFAPELLQTASPSWILPPSSFSVLNFAPELLQTASPSEFCLRQVRYLAPPAPKSFNFTFSSLRLENLPPAWKFASGEVLSISPQFCTPELLPICCLLKIWQTSPVRV